MRTLTDDRTYLTIFAEAEKNVRHRLFTEAYRYNGDVGLLIDEVVADTAHRLPYAVISAVTLDDLRDVCIGAAHEGMVNFHKRGIA